MAGHILDNLTRREILRMIAITPHTAVEIADGLEFEPTEPGGAPKKLDRSSIMRHLKLLEEGGYVEADVPPAERLGRNDVNWSSKPEQVDAHYKLLADRTNRRI